MKKFILGCSTILLGALIIQTDLFAGPNSNQPVRRYDTQLCISIPGGVGAGCKKPSPNGPCKETSICYFDEQ